MAIIAQRHGGYKAGLLIFCFGLVTFIVGFATPYWYTFIYTYTSSALVLKGHGGLWVTCVKGYFGESTCLNAGQSRDWEYAVKALEGASLAFMIISLFYAVYANFMAKTISISKLLEIGLGIAGGLGLAGAATYGPKRMQDADFISKQTIFAGHNFDFSLSWSFALVITGSALVIIALVLIAIFKKPLPQQQQPPTTTGFSHLGYAAPAGVPAPPPGHINVYATPGMVAYAAPPPTYYTSPNVGQVQGVGQGQAMGQVQGQASTPMVFDSPVGGQKQ